MDLRMPWHQTHSQPLSQPSESIQSSMDGTDVNVHIQESDNNETETDLFVGSDDTRHTNSVSSSSRRNVRNKSLFPTRISHKKQKKMSAAERLARCLDRMADIIENKSRSARQYGIQECMEMLCGLSWVEEGDQLWMYATRCFLKPAVREIFLTIKKDETRLKWLQFQYEWDMKRRRPSMPSIHASTGESHHNDNASIC